MYGTGNTKAREISGQPKLGQRAFKVYSDPWWCQKKQFKETGKGPIIHTCQNLEPMILALYLSFHVRRMTANRQRWPCQFVGRRYDQAGSYEKSGHFLGMSVE